MIGKVVQKFKYFENLTFFLFTVLYLSRFKNGDHKMYYSYVLTLLWLK